MTQFHEPHAPYTFVPISGKVLVRYQSPEEVPGHDVFDPDLKTGEIHVTMTAETPVFISDGNRDDPHFFRGPDGQYMIPGSSLRGMVRGNMEILGFGLFRPGEDFEEYQIYFRQMTASSASAEKELKEYYQTVLGIRPSRGRDGKTVSVPASVRAGYLCNEGGKFLIRPVKGGTYIRVPRRNEALVRAGLVDGEAETVSVVYSAGGSGVNYIRRSAGPVSGLQHGMLLYTGKGIGRQDSPKTQNARYLFPDPDETADPVVISEEDRISYAEDYETRRNVLGEKRSFWELPKPGGSKPVFYIIHGGHTYFGMSLFLRIGYRYSLQQGLPQRHRDLLAQGGEVMDYIHAMLGYAGENGSLRSRVSFGDCPVQGASREMPPVRTVLGQPKPSWYVGYSAGGKNYNQEDFQLAGRKQYWLRKAEADPALKENVTSVMRPLPEGTVFKGVIRYRNLHEDELGLLLWSLRLNENCRQSIGMGKPYGFGRMKLTVDQLLEYSPETLYSEDGLCSGPAAASEQTIQRYISAYDSYAAGKLYIKKPKKHPSISSQDEIRDFFYVRSAVQSGPAFSYMPLEEYRNPAGCLRTAKEVREGGPEKGQQKDSGSGSQSMEDLIRQFNSRRL